MTVPYETSAGAPLRVGAVVRDVLIVFALTAIGGFFIGLFAGITGRAHDPNMMILTIAGSNVLLGIVGFTISGSLARGNRWPHLAVVALGVWVLSLVNVAFMGTAIVQWLAASIVLAFMMGVGGALSYLFKR